MNTWKLLLLSVAGLTYTLVAQGFETSYEDHNDPRMCDYDYWADCLQGWYVGATGAFSWHDDHTFASTPSNEHRDYCPGVAAGVTLGKCLDQRWYMEFEWMFRRNTLDKIVDSADGVKKTAHGNNEDVTYMVNLLGRLPTMDHFDIYFGGGVGVSLNALELSEIAGVTQAPTTARSTEFAWQLMGGIVTKVSKNWEFFAGYRWFATARVKRPGDTVKSKDMPMSHNMDLGFRYKI